MAVLFTEPADTGAAKKIPANRVSGK